VLAATRWIFLEKLQRKKIEFVSAFLPLAPCTWKCPMQMLRPVWKGLEPLGGRNLPKSGGMASRVCTLAVRLSQIR
jgi:hypothetical protein